MRRSRFCASRHLGELERRVLGREGEVGLGDVDAVDLARRDLLRRGGGSAPLREGEAGRQAGRARPRASRLERSDRMAFMRDPLGFWPS